MMEDGSILDRIVQKTRAELEVRKAKILEELFESEGEVRSLKKAITRGKEKGNAVITEIKPASPSRGAIRQVDPVEVAWQMERGGACAISVLTEPFYFHGSLDNLKKARDAVRIPVMRKDFIIDEYQLKEARHYGADVVLLMVSVLGDETKRFYEKTQELGMEALVEVHDEGEADIAVSSGAEIIGINNRNLQDLSVDLNTTKMLRAKIPKNRLVVSESGIRTREDLVSVLEYADAALIGTSLMTSEDIEGGVRGFVR